ncbi:hypothetical protein L1887_47740 [Cichorium endivia]|nr:hypothetical protein L1887_47740 [Cichorium endivia]
MLQLCSSTQNRAVPWRAKDNAILLVELSARKCWQTQVERVACQEARHQAFHHGNGRQTPSHPHSLLQHPGHVQVSIAILSGNVCKVSYGADREACRLPLLKAASVHHADVVEARAAGK